MEDTFRIELPKKPLESNYQIGLVIPTYNRPNYLSSFLQSLQHSDLKNIIILIVDDASDNDKTLALINSFVIPDIQIIKLFRKYRKDCRIHENLRTGWDLLKDQYGCKYLCNLDSDTVVKRNWLLELQAVYKSKSLAKEKIIVTGFNAQKHRVLKQEKKYYVKETIGGLNMFFDLEIYDEVIRPSLIRINWDWKVIYAMNDKDYPFICTRPSVIQHIGQQGLWSSKYVGYDVAFDYWDNHFILMLPIKVYYNYHVYLRKIYAIIKELWCGKV